MQETVIYHAEFGGIRCNLNDEFLAQHIIELARNALGVEPSVRIREDTFAIRSGQQQAVQFFLKYGFPNGRKALIMAGLSDPKICFGTRTLPAFLLEEGSYRVYKRENKQQKTTKNN